MYNPRVGEYKTIMPPAENISRSIDYGGGIRVACVSPVQER
jgi:hypothetical protein